MEFHRKQRSWVAGLIAFLIGVALLGLYAVLVASGEAARSRRGGFTIVGIGALLVILGIAGVVRSMRPLRLRVDDAGITVRRRRRDVTFPWPAIAAARVEWPLNEESGTRGDAELWVYTAPGVNLGGKPDRVDAGYGAYYIVHVDQLREPWEQLEALLRRYAGPRFAVMNG